MTLSNDLEINFMCCSKNELSLLFSTLPVCVQATNRWSLRRRTLSAGFRQEHFQSCAGLQLSL